jgi:membrane-bound lytic murein transglycosylase F
MTNLYKLLLLLVLISTTLFLRHQYLASHPSNVTNSMSAYEIKKINNDIENRLPLWRKQFEKFGKKNNLPWTLLAAVAYQESKWNNDAVSFTGVRGLMQLTSTTAEYMGISDREDPIQSIQGGAMYLKYLYQKTPKHLKSSERWIQALAGYNMGWAHLRDIHRLARIKGINAYKWQELKKLLPLKADKKYQNQFHFGLARGQETADFIENVIGYYQYLNFQFPKKPFQYKNIASITLQSQTSLNF